MLNVTRIPHTIFIDAYGNNSHIQDGYMDKEAFLYQLSLISEIPAPVQEAAPAEPDQ